MRIINADFNFHKKPLKLLMIMNSIKKEKIIYLLLGALFLFSCQQEKKPLIAPPIPEMDIVYTNYTIDAAQGGILKHPNGTIIKIPSAALVDAKGNLILGNVEIKYREFHDAVDIFLSGIPMEYKDGNKNKIFQTAGMFDIRAKQGKQEVFLKSGKNAEIKMASYVKGDEYQFYSLNEEKRAWQLVGQPKVEPNKEKEALSVSLEEKKPEKFPFNAETHFIFDYNAFLDIQYGSVYSAKKIGKEKPASAQFKSYGISYLNIRLYNKILFKGKNYPASFMVWKTTANSQKMPKWVKEIKYHTEKIVHVGENTYGILLEERKTKRKFYTELEAVMPLTHLLRLPAEDWQNKYEEELAKILEEEKKADEMAAVFRTFSFGNFGIHNYDYFMKDDQRIDIFASFDFQLPEENSIENRAVEAVYLVCGDNRTIVKYNREMWANLPLTKNKGARMFTILPGKEIGIFSAEQFAQINFELLKQQKEPSYLFDFKKSGITINTPSDIKATLGIIKPNEMVL